MLCMLVWNYYTSLRIFWRTCFNSLEQDMQLAFSYRLLRIFTLTVWVLRSKQSLPKNQKEGFKTSFTFYTGDLERGSRCKHNDAACNASCSKQWLPSLRSTNSWMEHSYNSDRACLISTFSDCQLEGHFSHEYYHLLLKWCHCPTIQ